jgi:hypothetical protein
MTHVFEWCLHARTEAPPGLMAVEERRLEWPAPEAAADDGRRSRPVGARSRRPDQEGPQTAMFDTLALESSVARNRVLLA